MKIVKLPIVLLLIGLAGASFAGKSETKVKAMDELSDPSFLALKKDLRICVESAKYPECMEPLLAEKLHRVLYPLNDPETLSKGDIQAIEYNDRSKKATMEILKKTTPDSKIILQRCLDFAKPPHLKLIKEDFFEGYAGHGPIIIIQEPTNKDTRITCFFEKEKGKYKITGVSNDRN